MIILLGLFLSIVIVMLIIFEYKRTHNVFYPTVVFLFLELLHSGTGFLLLDSESSVAFTE